MICLTFCRDGKESFNFRVQKGEVTVGRGYNCDITLLSPTVSRVHFRIKEEGGRFILVDSSKNGTYVNLKRVERAQLKSGDRITFSEWEVKFKVFEKVWDEERTLSEVKDVRWSGSLIEKISKKYPDMEYFHGIVTRSPHLKAIIKSIKKIGESNEPVLILGETGTGKELVAMAIHRISSRNIMPFIALNCGAISEELFESELFGHIKGAFTGAIKDRDGAFQKADGGTLFLDEIGDLPLNLQVKLLRVLESKEIRKVGSNTVIKIDVRTICATNKRLDVEIEKGNFRRDLFYRLYILPICLPPLRERREDIPLLVDYFVASSLPEGRTIEFDSSAMDLLCNHYWPGNIRELRNLIIRSILTSRDDRITARDIHFLPFQPVAEIREEGFGYLKNREKEEIVRVLESCEWNRTRAAKLLGISRSTLFKKIERYGIKK